MKLLGVLLRLRVKLFSVLHRKQEMSASKGNVLFILLVGLPGFARVSMIQSD